MAPKGRRLCNADFTDEVISYVYEGFATIGDTIRDRLVTRSGTKNG